MLSLVSLPTKEPLFDTVAARKFVDGKLHTVLSTEDHQTKLSKQWSARCDQRLAEPVELLVSLDDDVDKTVHDKTQKITPKPISVARSPKSDEKELSPFFASRSPASC